MEVDIETTTPIALLKDTPLRKYEGGQQIWGHKPFIDAKSDVIVPPHHNHQFPAVTSGGIKTGA